MKLLFIYTHNGYRDFFLHKDVGMVPSFLSGNNEVDSLFYVESKKGRMKFKNLRISYTGKNWFISNGEPAFNDIERLQSRQKFF